MFDKVVALIREQLNIQQDVPITEETSFAQDLRADSFELMELIMAVEEEYGIQVEDSELEKMKTVGDVMNYIREQGIEVD